MMMVHPAIAYVTAIDTLVARRDETRNRLQAKSVRRSRSVELQSNRTTVSKKDRDASHTM